MKDRLLRWAIAGARRFALALAHAHSLGPGAAALALGRRRLGAALAGLHLAAALVAYPALTVHAPPLDWGAWWWHLALVVAWIALIVLPATALPHRLGSRVGGADAACRVRSASVLTGGPWSVDPATERLEPFLYRIQIGSG